MSAGNVDTRLRKLHETDLDGIILAAAGIKRLLKPEIITQFFDTEEMVPAVGQGALAIETREEDNRVVKLIAPLERPSSSSRSHRRKSRVGKPWWWMSSADWRVRRIC